MLATLAYGRGEPDVKSPCIAAAKGAFVFVKSLLKRLGVNQRIEAGANRRGGVLDEVTVPSDIQKGEISFKNIRDMVGKDDAIILEIGANGGEHTQRFLDAFPAGRVYCFEPEPRAIKRWKSRISDMRATLVETAVGRETGSIRFHRSDGDFGHGPHTGWDLSGSIKAPREHLEQHPKVVFDDQIDVPLCTLDDWTRDAGITEIDFIWADVQGAENDLIEGARETLARTRFFYTEYSNREMYEGQWSLEQIAKNLPDHRLMTRWRADALFELRTAGPG